MIADTDAVLLALRCMFSERSHTQDLGAESLARLLWIYGWLHWPPRTELVERALEALDIERGGGRVSDNDRRDEDREKRAKDHRAQDEEDELRAETERRGEQLREAWRKHHPREGRDEPKGGKP